MDDTYQRISKLEIATYLSTYYKLFWCASVYDEKRLIDLFTSIMYKDKLIQFSNPDYYKQMCLIYEFFFLVNYFGIKYDLDLLDLNEKEIENVHIFKDIFINKSDYDKFSKKQIIKYIRNAICHNDKDDRELYCLYRKDPNLFIEIELKNTKPIPFHVRLNLNDYIDVMLQLFNSNHSNQIRIEFPSDINSNNYMDKLDEIKILYLDMVEHGKNEEDSYSYNIQEFILNESQKTLIKNEVEKLDEKYKENFKELIEYLLYESLPLGYSKMDTMFYGLFITDDIYKFTYSLQKLNEKLEQNGYMDDFKYYLLSKKVTDYCIFSYIVFARYMLDTVVTSDLVNIGNKNIPRNKLRNSLTHGKWCLDGDFLQLYDSFNSKSIYDYNWHEAISFDDFLKFMNNAYNDLFNKRDKNFLDRRISLEYSYQTGELLHITCTKDEKKYVYNLTPTEDGLLLWGLYRMDNESIKFVIDPIEAKMFFDELKKLPHDDKTQYVTLLEMLEPQYHLALNCELGLIPREVLNENYHIISSSNKNKEEIKIKSKKYGLLS